MLLSNVVITCNICLFYIVIKATILSRKVESPPGMSYAGNMMYQAKVDRVYKGEEEGVKQDEIVTIQTSASDAMCGNTYLQDDKSYLLTGKLLVFFDNTFLKSVS